jgi:hypothetical protein
VGDVSPSKRIGGIFIREALGGRFSFAAAAGADAAFFVFDSDAATGVESEDLAARAVEGFAALAADGLAAFFGTLALLSEFLDFISQSQP